MGTKFDVLKPDEKLAARDFVSEKFAEMGRSPPEAEFELCAKALPLASLKCFVE